jgi:ABC-type nickel/cobalt efflux system permease component RcnA
VHGTYDTAIREWPIFKQAIVASNSESPSTGENKMKNMQKVTIWLAGLFACAGSVCILGFLIKESSQEYFLLGAVIATTISVATLLVSIFFLSPPSVFLSHRTQYRVVTAMPKNIANQDLPK